jgi:hypothetical protein
MKKLIVMAGAALLLAGCNQGGSSDPYGTDAGTSTDSGTTVSTNYNQMDSQGGAGGLSDPSGTNVGGAADPGAAGGAGNP